MLAVVRRAEMLVQAILFLCVYSAVSLDEVGNLGGDFSVEHGQAVYKVPVMLPQGPGNIKPDVNLVYNSGSGNGMLGLGWSIDVLSTISRCPHTLAQDGEVRGIDYSKRDRFCLDGQRLVAINGHYGSPLTEYRTEVDTYRKVISMGKQGTGPRFFRVWTKEGTILEYGCTNLSQVMGNTQDSVHQWNLQLIMDRFGNNITLSYVRNTTMLASLTYGTASLIMRYQERPDKSFVYFKGSVYYNETKRAIGLEIKNKQQRIRYYEFNYKPSKQNSLNISILESIRLCDPKMSCFRPLVFNYNSTDQLVETLDAPSMSISDYGSGWSVLENPRYILDINGDGFTDILAFGKDCIQVSLNKGNGSFFPGDCWADGYGYNTGWRGINHPRLPGDINGDGLADVVIFASDGVRVLFNTGNSFESAKTLSNSFGYSSGWRTQNHLRFVQDINGDGRADIIGFGFEGVEVALSEGEKLGPKKLWISDLGYKHTWRISTNPRFLGDVNGDTLPDIVAFANDGVYVALNNGSHFGPKTKWIGAYGTYHGWNSNHLRYIKDINGDGLADIVGFWNEGVYTSFSTGISFTIAEKNIAKFGYRAGGWNVVNHPRYVEDVTGDGLPDIVGFANDGAYVSVNIGGTFSRYKKWLDAFGHSQGGWNINSFPRHVTDTNGDGIADIIGFSGSGVLSSMNKNRSPVIHKFSDSFGVTQSVIYLPLPRAMKRGHYEKTSSGKYPFQTPVPPALTVIKHNQNENSASYNTTEYYYGDLKVHVTGYGSLGFSWVEKTSSEKTSSVMFIAQDFPCTGKVIRKTQSALIGDKKIIVSDTNLTYSVQNKSLVQQVILEREHVIFNEINGHFISASEVVYKQTNRFGDPLKITSTTSGESESFIKEVINTYDNYEDKWIIGLLKSSKVTHICPCQKKITRNMTYRYDANTGALLSFTTGPDDMLGLTTEQSFDKFGNLVKKEEYSVRDKGHQRKVTTNFDVSGINKITSSNTFGHTETYKHDKYDNIVEMTGVNGLKTKWTYDGFGRKVSEELADGSKITWLYNWDESTPLSTYNIKMVSEGSPNKTKVFDALERVVEEKINGSNFNVIHIIYSYNRQGLIHKQSYPFYATDARVWEEFYYDLRGRVTEKRSPGFNDSIAREQIIYDGVTTTEINALGNTVSYEKDVLGRLVKVTDALGGTVEYTYDALNNIIKTVDMDGFVTTSRYDGMGHRTEHVDPDMGKWQYKHNAFGELIWQKDANGNILEQEFDSVGRLVKRTEPEGTTTWQYDTQTKGLGKLGTVENEDGFKKTWYYDSYGRENKLVISTEGNEYGITTTYDSHGRISEQKYPQGETLLKSYSANGYLVEIKLKDPSNNDDKSIWRGLSYDASDHLTKELYGNGLVTNYDLDSAGNLMKISTYKEGQGTVRDLRYTYDVNENLLSRMDLIQSMSETFVYDKLDRLTQSTVHSDGNVYQRRQNWDYHKNGNLRFNDMYGLGPFIYHPNKPHAIIKAGQHEYSYDENGNVIERDGKKIEWTSYNKPSNFEVAQGSISFEYDPENRQRYLKTLPNGDKTLYLGSSYELDIRKNGTSSNLYVHDTAGRLIAVIKKSITKTSEAKVTYFHTDNLDSVDTTTSEDGTVIDRFNYGAFGRKRNGNWQESAGGSQKELRGFTGHEHLEGLDLINMNGRVYDPLVGRFLSPDPHVQDPLNTQSLNRYTYALNNPLKYKDPSGYFFKKIKRFFKKHIRTIAAVAVSALTLGFATPIAMGIIGAIGVTGAAASVATGALAGAASGFLGGAVASGNIKGALQGAVGGAVFGGIGGHFGNTWNIERVATRAVAGGTLAELGGGEFKDGFLLAGRLASARFLYNQIVSFDVTFKPGGPAEPSTAETLPRPGVNVIGTHTNGEPIDPSWFDKDQFLNINWKNGGGLSRALNKVPGINAVAGMHDVFQVKLDSVFFPGARNIFNVPGMIPAAAITYVALGDEAGLPALLVDKTKEKNN